MKVRKARHGLFALALLAGSADASASREWRFTAFLDDKPIGYHRFQVREQGADTFLVSEARFQVKFLFFDVYRYEHESRELWRNGCLRRIDARTNDNGGQAHVRGTHAAAGFRIDTLDGAAALPPCVRTFAYWDPRILKADRLLNAQTGEYVAVEVQRLGEDPIAVAGALQPAEHYRLKADKFAIDLWYSPDDRWLALESTTANGRRLRYRME